MSFSAADLSFCTYERYIISRHENELVYDTITMLQIYKDPCGSIIAQCPRGMTDNFSSVMFSTLFDAQYPKSTSQLRDDGVV